MPSFKRIKVSEYIKANFLPPFPCAQTIVRSIKSGELPGSQLGNLWYVHVDDNGEAIKELTEYEIQALEMLQDWKNAAAS